MSLLGSGNTLRSRSIIQGGLGVFQIAYGVSLASTTNENDRISDVASSVFISSGLNTLMYAISDPLDEFRTSKESYWAYGKEFLCGGLLGGIGACLSAAGFASSIGSRILGGMIYSPLREVVHKYSKTGKLPSVKILKAKAMTGGARGFTGYFGGALVAHVSRVVYPVTHITYDMEVRMMDIVYRAIQGGIEGGIVCAACQVVSNVCSEVLEGKDRDRSRGVVKSTLIGVCFGATIGGFIQWQNNRILTLQIEIRKLQEQILQLEYKKTAHEFFSYAIVAGCASGNPVACVGGALTYFVFHPSLTEYGGRILAYFDKALLPEVDGPLLPAMVPQLAVNDVYEQATLIQTFYSVSKALQPELKVTFSNCDPHELFKHVVLVQVICQDYYDLGIKDGMLEKFGFSQANPPWEEKDARYLFALLGILSAKGEIGHHLDFEKIQFNNKEIPRPTVHWSWNQLVQPNSGGTWEEELIAILQPLEDFESSEEGKPFNLAPYDTFFIGKQTLKNRAIVLIPDTFQEFIDKLREHYATSQIKFVTYDHRKKLREAVMDQLEQDPNVWHMCDYQGNLLGREESYQRGGYEEMTCIKKSNQEVIRLLWKANTQIGNSLNVKGRMVDLHHNLTSTYFPCDHIGHAYTKALNRFKCNKASYWQSRFFAGNIENKEDLESMGSLIMLKSYHALRQYDPATNCVRDADYIMAEAIYADMVSLFCKQNPEAALAFSKFDFKLMIEPKLPGLIQFLQNIDVNLRNGQDPFVPFNVYTSALIERMERCLQAKASARHIIQEPATSPMKIPAYIFDIGNAEWRHVSIPDESPNFNLDKDWPLTEELNAYKDKILQVLLQNEENLQALYQCLEPTNEISNENYRKTVIRGFIFALIQEQCFLKNQTYAESSILRPRTLNNADEL